MQFLPTAKAGGFLAEMIYHVVFSDGARKELKKLDKYSALLLLGWIRKNLEGCADPRRNGKELIANRRGQWRYRIGDYRIIVEISDDTVTILVISVGHRR